MRRFNIHCADGRGPQEKDKRQGNKDPREEHKKRQHRERDNFPNRVSPMPHEQDKKKGPKF